MNKVAFIDMEGVLVPEIWKFLASQLGISELSITTREVEDYEKLMLYRIAVLEKHQITLPEYKVLSGNSIQLKNSRVSETLRIRVLIFRSYRLFYELLEVFLHQLEVPIETIYCHRLQCNDKGFIKKVLYSRQKGKHEIMKNIHYH